MHTLRRFMQTNRFPLVVATVWLVTIWAAVLLAQHLYHQPLNLAAWAGDWDGGWYHSIVDQGYTSGLPHGQDNVAFFPLMPLLVWLLKAITALPTVWAGMVVSTVCFFVALALLYTFVIRHFDERLARWTVLLLAFNPFSYYFGMMYTESLFLLLAVLTFWFVYQRHWWRAALFAGLATATRSVGVALGAVVIVAYFTNAKRRKWGGRYWGFLQAGLPSGQQDTVSDRTPSSFWFKLVGLLLLSFSGVIIFTLYLWHHTGNPFAYQAAQMYWPGRGNLVDLAKEIVLLFMPAHINKEYAIKMMWAASAVVALTGAWLVLRMRHYLMALFAGIALALPLAFGTTGSMNRYAQVVFPVFIAYAALLVRWPRWARFTIIGAFYAGLCVVLVMIINPQHIFIG